MLWLKALHIIAFTAWFAGLFYLPRLLIYHIATNDPSSLSRFQVMESRLYYRIMWPAALLTTIFGIAILFMNMSYYLKQPWMHAKLALVLILWGIHLLDGYYIKQFQYATQHPSDLFLRIFNEIPTVLLISIVILVVVKP